jgi:signal transduction histidine kinase
MTTADETRRRLERDLHDGVQQRLVHTVITLKLARQTMGNGDGPAVELVDESLEATAYFIVADRSRTSPSTRRPATPRSPRRSSTVRCTSRAVRAGAR